MKKYILIFVPIVTMVLFGYFLKASPEQRVQELQKQKRNDFDKSGYYECLGKIEENNSLREAGKKQCISNALVEAGFTDDLDCIEIAVTNPENEICKNTERYNAQIEAQNACSEKFERKEDDLTGWDCQELLK